jgi:hypothetical protein
VEEPVKDKDGFEKEPSHESVREGLEGFDPYKFMNERVERDKIGADRLLHDALVVARGEVKHNIINVDENTGRMTQTLVDSPGEYRVLTTIEQIRKVVAEGPQKGSGGQDNDLLHDAIGIIDSQAEEIQRLNGIIGVVEKSDTTLVDAQAAKIKELEAELEAVRAALNPGPTGPTPSA